MQIIINNQQITVDRLQMARKLLTPNDVDIIITSPQNDVINQEVETKMLNLEFDNTKLSILIKYTFYDEILSQYIFLGEEI